jgi:hypothetical protein
VKLGQYLEGNYGYPGCWHGTRVAGRQHIVTSHELNPLDPRAERDLVGKTGHLQTRVAKVLNWLA